MGQIKNKAGHVFADLNEWKEWAILEKEPISCDNIHSDLVRFVSFYPWIITNEEDGAIKTEEFSSKLTEKLRYPYAYILSLNKEDIFSIEYDWMKELYVFLHMKLENNGDDTYTLKGFKYIKGHSVLDGECLRIPECVSCVDYKALMNKRFKHIVFPKNFVSNSPIYVSLDSSDLWDPTTIAPRQPIEIESDKDRLSGVKNPYFSDLRYNTFKRLCSVWPSAFSGVEGYDPKSTIEEIVYLDKGGNIRRLTEDSVYVSYAPSNGKLSNDIVFASSQMKKDSYQLPLNECRIVAMEISPETYRETAEVKHAIIPESVDLLIVGRQLDELTILGNPRYVYLDDVPKKIRVNCALSEVKSETLKELYRKDGASRIIFNVPELCHEESVNPGYIRATALCGRSYEPIYDIVVEINTNFIVSREPVEIDIRDRVITGTKIFLAWQDVERYQKVYIVYEPMEMIAEKINNA